MRSFLFILLLFVSLLGHAQPLPQGSKFSLVTVDVGNELHSLFGHSALRVQVPGGEDIIWNWGVFSWGDSDFDFAMKYARGRLEYQLAKENYSDFIMQYDWEQRSAWEVELNLTEEQKQNLWQAILVNYMPENRYYKYDFFYDNCATRIRDLLEKSIGSELKWNHPDANKYTIRNIIDVNLAPQPWTDFGVDLALGAQIDEKADERDLMFLPSYVQDNVLNATIGDKSLAIGEPRVLINFPRVDVEESSWFSPSTLFWGILILAAVLWFLRAGLGGRIFDGFFFSAMFLASIMVILLWFATDHIATKNNWNLLWANPVHIIVLWMLIRKKSRAKMNKVMLGLAIYFFGLLLFWFVLPQEFNPYARPLILAIGIRYYWWYKTTKPILQ